MLTGQVSILDHTSGHTLLLCMLLHGPQANVTAALHGPPNAQLSGRTRHSTSDHESVELNITFLTDPRRSDQIVRGVVVLPHGSGKPVRIAVFAKGKAAEVARAAGEFRYNGCVGGRDTGCVGHWVCGWLGEGEGQEVVATPPAVDR